MAAVSMRGIRKTFDGQDVLKGIDLDVEDGQFLVLVGPSGCGKSTLLRIIAGLEAVGAGELEIGGRLSNDIPAAERGVAMVFQNYALYPHMTVAQNMGFALRLAGVRKEEIAERVHKAATILAIEHLLDRKPKALSGGQQQRVAIGRAIVRRPGVFLFDEPLSNLDAALRVQTRVELARLHKELNTTMIYVTHDQVEAMTLGEKIVVLNAGTVEQIGTPLELYNRPATRFVAGFLGAPKMNFFEGRFTGAQERRAFVRLADETQIKLEADCHGMEPGSPVTLGVRPEHLLIKAHNDEGNCIPARLAMFEHLGDSMVCYAQVAGMQDLASIKCRPDTALPPIGSSIFLAVPACHGHLFDERGFAVHHPAQI